MTAVSCMDCGTEISAGSRRCRRCHREAWSSSGPFGNPDPVTPPAPEQLWTGTELLERIWPGWVADEG